MCPNNRKADYCARQVLYNRNFENQICLVAFYSFPFPFFLSSQITPFPPQYPPTFFLFLHNWLQFQNFPTMTSVYSESHTTFVAPPKPNLDTYSATDNQYPLICSDILVDLSDPETVRPLIHKVFPAWVSAPIFVEGSNGAGSSESGMYICY